jgi:hypothetical protein
MRNRNVHNYVLTNILRDAIVEVPKLHSGSVKGLCVSSFQPNLIASGATNAEVIFQFFAHMFEY